MICSCANELTLYGEKSQIVHCVCLNTVVEINSSELIDHSAHDACLFLEFFATSGSVYSGPTHSLFPDSLLISELSSGFLANTAL